MVSSPCPSPKRAPTAAPSSLVEGSSANTPAASSATPNWSLLVLHKVEPTGKDIGRGAYGRVLEVNYEGTLCAAKKIP